MNSQSSTSKDKVPNPVTNVPSSTNNIKKEPPENPGKHYISEKNGPDDIFPSDKYLDVNDICEIPFLKNDKKCSLQLTETRFVQINSLASNRVEYYTETISISTNDLEKGTTINESVRKIAKELGEENDQAGHLLAKQLGGEGDEYNVIPQNAKINQGNWKTMENVFLKDIKKYDTVKFTFRVMYDDTHREFMKRPKEFLFKVETEQGKLIRFGKVDNSPIINFVELEQCLIKNLKQIWDDNKSGRPFILSLNEELFKKILSSDKLTIKNEYYIWQVIYNWVMFDKSKRLENLHILIKNVKFYQISDYFINIFISNCVLFNEIKTGDQQNVKLELEKYVFSENIQISAENQTYETAYFLVCSTCIQTENLVQVLDFERKTWHITNTLSLKQCQNNVFDCDYFNNSFLAKNVSELLKKVEQLIDRKYASEITYDNCTYIAGGINEKGVVVKSVKKYDSKKWISIKPMTTARRNFSLVFYKKRLWAIGGIDDNLPLSSVESYDFEKETWLEEKSLNDTRYNHAAIEFDGELYVVGGLGQHNDFIVEKYDSKENRWVQHSKLRKVVPKSHLSILNSEISSKISSNSVETQEVCDLMKKFTIKDGE